MGLSKGTHCQPKVIGAKPMPIGPPIWGAAKKKPLPGANSSAVMERGWGQLGRVPAGL